MSNERRTILAEGDDDDGGGESGLDGTLAPQLLAHHGCSFGEGDSIEAWMKTMKAPSTRDGARRTIFHPCL